MRPTDHHHQPPASTHQLGYFLALLATALCTGCLAAKPLKGGRAQITKSQAGDLTQILTQGQNAAQPSKQDQHTIHVRSFTLPQASEVQELRVQKTTTGILLTNVQTTTLSAPTPVIDREESYATTELGAAQKDTAREIGAKLSSLKPIIWVGISLFIFGLASLVWPPLRAIIGSLTTSAAITAGGVALIILPTLLLGNELLILAAVALTVAAWFLAHRHGHARGMLATNAAIPRKLNGTQHRAK